MTPEDVTFFELKVLSHVRRYPSIRSVARALQLRPAHVSKVIQRLERKLETQLVSRSVTGLLLTRDGQNYLDFADRILEYSVEFRSGVPNRGLSSRCITVGSVSYLHKYLLAPVIGSLEAGFGSVRFRIIDQPPDELAVSALRGAFDVMLHTQKDGWTKLWNCDEVGVIHWGLFGRSGHPLRGRVSEREILEYRFVVPTYWDGNQFTTGNDLCPVSWEKRCRGHEAPSADSAARLCQSTDQLAYLPQLIGNASEFALREILVAGWPVVSRSVYLFVNIDSVRAKERHSMKLLLRQRCEAIAGGIVGEE